VECGLGAAGRSTTARDTGTWIVFSGKAEGASQDNLFAAGTCLAMTPTQILGQTACANPHQAEVTGFARAPASVTSPGSPAFTDTAQASCAAVAGKFLGRPFRTSSGMHIGWTLISSIGWQVGERTFNCTIEFSTTAGQFLAHTGALARA
jgi:hypothetical protein